MARCLKAFRSASSSLVDGNKEFAVKNGDLGHSVFQVTPDNARVMFSVRVRVGVRVRS